jgi:3-hydroxyisobutyrate dehydrogenase-like beta-hydroxyacid dehydrogenase
MDEMIKNPVTLIGLGPMGQAMTRVFLAAGHPTTVWNRTASRAAELIGEGAKPAATPAEAVAASELLVLSLTDYQAMYDILSPVSETLAGKTVVNLSSDTPERTRVAAEWMAEHGARFVVGGVMVPAPAVGTEGAYVYYSGPKDVFEAHAPTLRLIGRTRYVGEDPGLAQLYYQAQLDVFLTSLSALLHATALVGSAGVSAAEFVPQAMETFAGLEAMIGDTAAQLDSGVHPGHLSTALMMGATADHILGASEAAGIDLTLPKAIKAHYDAAIAAGHGKDNWTSLFEVIKKG